MRGRIVDAIKETGFTYVALDLDGFRSGSMNEVIQSNGTHD
jgi:PP-loop superfamily ATP-utilizing enzyme